MRWPACLSCGHCLCRVDDRLCHFAIAADVEITVRMAWCLAGRCIATPSRWFKSMSSPTCLSCRHCLLCRFVTVYVASVDVEGIVRKLMSCRDLNGNFITMIPADAFTNLTQLRELFVVCVWVTVCSCWFWEPCWDKLMTCSYLNGNFITTIFSDAFANLTQLRILFVFVWMSGRVCHCWWWEHCERTDVLQGLDWQ